LASTENGEDGQVGGENRINDLQLLYFKLKNRVANQEQIEYLAKEKLGELNKYWKRIIKV